MLAKHTESAVATWAGLSIKTNYKSYCVSMESIERMEREEHLKNENKTGSSKLPIYTCI